MLKYAAEGRNRAGSSTEPIANVNPTVAAAAAALLSRGATSASLSGVGASSRAQRAEAFAARRSASEPVRDFDDDEADEEEEEDLSFASEGRPRRSGVLNHRHHPGRHAEEGSSASASTKTSSLVQEGHDDDSYDSSCGSDDRSDVASWIALDLRAMHHNQQQHRRGGGHHSREPSNGYDTITLDSADFYGYAPSQTGSHQSAADSQQHHWTPRSHERRRDWREHRGRHSASPAHYLNS